MPIHGAAATSEESAARGGCNRSTRPRERIYRGHRVYDASRHEEDNRRLIGSLRPKRVRSIEKKLTPDRFSSRGYGYSGIGCDRTGNLPSTRNARGKRLANIDPRDLRPIRRRKSTFETRDHEVFRLLVSVSDSRIHRLKIRGR